MQGLLNIQRLTSDPAVHPAAGVCSWVGGVAPPPQERAELCHMATSKPDFTVVFSLNDVFNAAAVDVLSTHRD